MSSLIASIDKKKHKT